MKDTDRTLNAPANETNEAEAQIVMNPIFEVKTGAQYLADIKEFPVQPLAYHYVIKDHLGSPRVVFQDVNGNNSIDFATDLEDVKNYYPFGLEWETATQEVRKYRNAYNDKERISFTKYLDFGARNYLKTANVFDGPDPLADHPNLVQYSPYVYPVNNPVLHTDPDGRCPPWICGAIAGAAVEAGSQVGRN
jgi:RHS repeat-associated protein